MNAPTAISAMARQVPPAPVLQVLSRYRREDIEAFVAIAIDLMDLADGDPDIENATDAEDEGITDEALAYTDGPGCLISDDAGIADEDGVNMPSAYAHADKGAGCTISDPDFAVDDRGCDPETDGL